MSITLQKNSVCFQLNVLTDCVDFSTIKNVYYANFHSIMAYGITVWGGTTSTNFDRIFQIQKRAVRIIHSKPFREHCKPLFIASQILTLPCIYILEVSKYFIKNKTKFAT